MPPSASESKMNLSALQQVDSEINEIVESATQVALFQYSPQSSQWTKTAVEGALFVYAHRNPQQRGIIILNRLSPKNYHEAITAEIEFKINVPFLIYKTPEGSILGAWFYVKEECQRIGQVCTRHVSYLKKRSKKLSNPQPSIIQDLAPPTPNGNVNGRDIMSLLQKAHEDKDVKASKKPLGPTNQNRKQERKSEHGKGAGTPTPGVPVVHKPVPTNTLPPSVEQLFKSVGQDKQAQPTLQNGGVNHLERLLSSCASPPTVKAPVVPATPPMNNCMAEILNKLNDSAQKVIAEHRHQQQQQRVSPTSQPSQQEKKLTLITPEMLEESLSQEAPTTMSRGELKSTLVHLLENDDEFLSKIHSAYVQSCGRSNRKLAT